MIVRIMKVLIYGGHGWIGNQLIELLNSKSIENHTSDIKIGFENNFEKISKEIKESNATHVMCVLGRTHGPGCSTIDYLEQKGKLVENVRDNLYSPIVLSHICTQNDVHLTYIGTGCIFNGDNITEDTLPNFFGSSYSIVKGFTDRLLKDMYSNSVLNLRIRMPINAEKNPRNLITKLTKYSKICSIDNSMTVLPDILPIIINMMQDRKVGTFNMTNPGVISHNQILSLYKQYVDPSFEWDNFDIDEQNKVISSERSNNHLDTSKLQMMYPNVLNVYEAVEKIMQRYR